MTVMLGDHVHDLKSSSSQNLPRLLVATKTRLTMTNNRCPIEILPCVGSGLGLDDGATKVVELRRELHSEFGTPTAVSQVLCLCQCLYVRHVPTVPFYDNAEKKQRKRVVHILTASCVVRSTRGVVRRGCCVLQSVSVCR